MKLDPMGEDIQISEWQFESKPDVVTARVFKALKEVVARKEAIIENRSFRKGYMQIVQFQCNISTDDTNYIMTTNTKIRQRREKSREERDCDSSKAH